MKRKQVEGINMAHATWFLTLAVVSTATLSAAVLFLVLVR